MRKVWSKKKILATVILSAVLVCAMTGCGKKQNENTAENKGLSKVNVYKIQPYDVASVLENFKEYSMNGIAKNGDQIYAFASRYNGTVTNVKVISMSQDGKTEGLTDLQTWMNGVDPHESVSEGNADSAYSYVGFDNFKVSPEGVILALKNYNFYDYSDAENTIEISEQYVCAWKQDGTMLWETKLEPGQKDGYQYVRCMGVQKDGGVFVLFTGDSAGVVTIDGQGKIGKRQTIEGEVGESIQNSNAVIPKEDGSIYIIYNSADDAGKWYAATYDVTNNSFGEKMELSSTVAWNGLYNAVCDETGALFYHNSEGVYRYRIGEAGAEQIMSLVNSDLDAMGFDSFIPLDEEHFVACYSETDAVSYASTPVIGVFTKVPEDQVPDKKELVLGGNFINWQLRSRVVKFNKENNEYRIVIKNYDMENSYEDTSAGLTKLNLDITTGKMPDILVVDENIDLRKYAASGLLADVEKLIVQDAEISKLKYLDSVFEACKINGTLYEVVPWFAIDTYVGKASIVGNRESWTITDAQKLMKELPEGTKLFGDVIRSGFLSEIMNYCGQSFVDLTTGKCNFDTAEFKAMLEYAGTLPEEIDYSGDDMLLDDQMQYRQGSTVLAGFYLNDPARYKERKYGEFGEDISFIGFPGTGGTGAVLRTDTTYVLSAKSENLGAAWDFVKYYLTEEYQSQDYYMLPVLEKQLNVLAAKTMEKPFYLDEEGNKVEYDDTYWAGGEEVVLPVLSQNEVDVIVRFIKSVRNRGYRNQEILNIISEEAAAYFAGQKDVDAVAKLIQNRVQLYVDENG